MKKQNLGSKAKIKIRKEATEKTKNKTKFQIFRHNH